MNPWLICILLILTVHCLLDLGVSVVNLKALTADLPREFAEVLTPDDYQRSLEYTRATTSVAVTEEGLITGVTLAFLLLGGFNLVDLWARSLGFEPLFTGLIYTAALLLLSWLIALPFSIYSTFVIDSRFGLNKTTIATFVLDHLKIALLAVIIGGPVLALVLVFFERSGRLAWLYCWIGLVIVVIILQYLAPVLIMPLFNTFTPLPEGPLKKSVTGYARKMNFKIQGIFTMDGSRRSTKLNAFFTGFGRFRKIVFYDTLLERLSDQEITAVLAHEMGHYKLHHIFKMLVVSLLHTGTLFFLLSVIMKNKGLFAAFRMDNISTYASLVFFSFLFSPLNLLVSVICNIFSRHHEYDADRFAAETTGSGEHLIGSLKKLSRSNLSNLTPHPFYVFLHYSHPPVLERIRALKEMPRRADDDKASDLLL